MEKINKMKREELLLNLEKQFKEKFAGKGYKDEFVPDGAMPECYFGSKFLIISNSGDSVLVWSDWGDNAVSEQLEEYEIEYCITEPGFYIGEDFYFLNHFERICNHLKTEK